MELMTNHRGRWKPGESGNPSGLPGRPLGSRQAFSANFLRDLGIVWQEEGVAAIRATAKLNPPVFFATCARLVPQDVRLTVEQEYAGIDQTDLELLRAIRTALPSANQMTPQAAFEYTLEALRAHAAKATDGNCP